ncbi:MAG: hypothetical protein AB4062_20365 [Crocosphaera sp.]
MKYITCLFLGGSILASFTDTAWGANFLTSFPLSNMDVREDSVIMPKVPYKTTRNTSQSYSVEETKRRLAQHISIQLANDIAYGLVIAHDKRQIRYGTTMYRKVQTAINLLRRGAGLNGASRRSGVPRPVLDQLMKWGQQRPGASLYHVE